MFDLSSARFAFFDMETTGLSPWFGDRICEVGIVLTEGRRVKQQVHMLVNPEYPLSLGAASTSGLTDEMLVNAPLFGEVAKDIVEWLKGTVVVCHNAQFDVQFLDSEFRRLGREIQIPNLVDTLLLSPPAFRPAVLQPALSGRVVPRPDDHIPPRPARCPHRTRRLFRDHGLAEAIQQAAGRLHRDL